MKRVEEQAAIVKQHPGEKLVFQRPYGSILEGIPVHILKPPQNIQDSFRIHL